MQFDFATAPDRRGHDALAIDSIGIDPTAPAAPRAGFDAIPMWVADMAFKTCPAVTEAIGRRLAQPHFGYFEPSEEYLSAILSWQRDRNGVVGLEPQHVGYENGVLGGLVSALAALTSPGDSVLVHSPTYIGFTKSISNAGYRIVSSPLILDEEGVWRMDFDDMERRLVESRAHVAVFCSPHNPCGRVWERAEIERAMEVYAAHDVMVISDEIWSDIIRPGLVHTPTQSVSDDARRRTVALYAPSKTFSLAGLVGSYHIIYDDYLRDRVDACASKSHYNMMNVLSMHALMGAYSEEGRAWTDELRVVIAENVDRACDVIDERFDGVDVVRPQGTYMIFPDCSAWCARHGKTLDELLAAGWDVGVGWQDGRPFHGACNIRLNLALPAARLEEALDRLDRYVFNPR